MLSQQTANPSTTIHLKVLSVPMMFRLEALIVLAATIALYSEVRGQWLLFAVLFLAPDLAFIPVLINQGLGRHVYNTMHTYSLPVGVAALAYFLDWESILGIALIWTAHIAMDRLVGYGLKYRIDGKETHLQRV